MNIRHLLIGEIVVFVALLGAILGATLALAGSAGSDALYVNIAGRQRMLSQKAAKEALSYARDPSAAHRERLQGTVQLFEASHRALRHGGESPLDLDGGSPVVVQEPSDESLIQLLDTVELHWNAMNEGIDQLFRVSERRAEALALLNEKSPRLLESMDQVVRYFAADKDVGGTVINIAGRQRMLSERVALLALLLDIQPTPEGHAELDKTLALFDSSHIGLRHGGQTPLRMDGSRLVRLSGSRSGRIGEKLDEVEGLWKVRRAAIDTLSSKDGGYRTALVQIEESSPQVLFAMNDAMLRSQAVAEEKRVRLRKVQIGALALGLVVAVLGGIFAMHIGRSLVRLRTIADAISKGHVNETVEPVGMGEVRALSESFERMRFSLSATMEMLEREDKEGSISA